MEQAHERFDKALHRVGSHPLAMALEVAKHEVVMTELELAHAQLCRMLPHRGDVIALGCFPELLPTPERLGPDGSPRRVITPTHFYEQGTGAAVCQDSDDVPGADPGEEVANA